VCAICIAPARGQGRNPLYLPFESRNSSLALRGKFFIPAVSVAYRFDAGFNRLDSTSTRHSDCPSLNKRRLPRLSSPSEALGQRIDLIVVAAGK
jgi:hypothetical protein